MSDIKLLQSDWSRAFCLISQEPDIFQIWDLCRNTTNSINFHNRTNAEKIMTKLFNNFKKSFWPVLPIFGAKQIFQKNPAL